jgi:hypothetical protein
MFDLSLVQDEATAVANLRGILHIAKAAVKVKIVSWIPFN